jgi:hypothetical protein
MVLHPKIGVVTVLPGKRPLHTVPSGVVRLEGTKGLYFHDPLGRSAAACKQPIEPSSHSQIGLLNTPTLRASGAPPRLKSIEVPEVLQAELRDSATDAGSDPRSLASAVRLFVKSFVEEHAVTKMFVATLLVWKEVGDKEDPVYEVHFADLLRSALGRRLLVSHTLQLKGGKATLTLAQVNANFETWATQVWTFDVPDNARRALVHVPAYTPRETPPDLELAVLANERTRSNPRFTPKQKKRWEELAGDRIAQQEYSGALAEHLGINRRKVARALGGVASIAIRQLSSAPTTLHVPACIEQFIVGEHLDHASRCTVSSIFSRVVMLLGNSGYVDSIVAAFAAFQSTKSMQAFQQVRNADTNNRQRGGDDFLPCCATLQDKGKRFCRAKSTEECAAKHGITQVSHNQNPADMMVGQKTSVAPALNPFKKRRLNSTVS